MDMNLLDIKFARIRARLQVADRPSRRSRISGAVTLDVQTDRKGEFFEIAGPPGAEAQVAVLDVQPADRHLLLLVREGKAKSKFLRGHDERHWFVAGIPESAPIGTVRQGEWFFLPVPGFAVDDKLVLSNEPLRRGNGDKPHWAEFC